MITSVTNFTLSFNEGFNLTACCAFIMKTLKCIFISIMMAIPAHANGIKTVADYRIVPLPQIIDASPAKPFILHSSSGIYYPEGDKLHKRNAKFLSDYLHEITGQEIKTRAYSKKCIPKEGIILCLDNSILSKEGYTLTVNENRISIAGQTPQGVFYGIQTLRKAIPPHNQSGRIEFPSVHIEDAPRFAYRGMMLDVARHFFPIEFVKEFIDLLALHNMNTFHWHLTDDQGWRIEIKKYPKLTEVGSRRSETVIGRNTGKYDQTPHGGYYTQEEIKEIVDYATQRYINVIPEIDLPGHTLAALAAYPELGCTKGPYEVSKRWGIFPDVLCIGSEKAMQFLEDVLTEVVELFPSEYIHIGGDEAPRTRWINCTACQARIRTENLKADKSHTAEDRLQSYCMKRMERHLNSKGRNIIGWDEILEGDVAPHATIMSWRGIKGGIAAATMGHNVIMAPNSYLYFDYYQTSRIEKEPLANSGGCTTIKQTYHYDPFEGLDENVRKHIIGVQANLWTEYIPTPNQAEYMILPRMGALAEVQWSDPEKKDYTDFVLRQKRLMSFYERQGLRYATHIYHTDVTTTPDDMGHRIKVTINNPQKADIYYTLNNVSPTICYSTPFFINKDTELEITAGKDIPKEKITKRLVLSKSTGCSVTLLNYPHHRYFFKGAKTLTDGEKGTEDYLNGEWIAFYNCNLQATITLKAIMPVAGISLNALVKLKSGHTDIRKISVEVSDDGIHFKQIAVRSYPEKVTEEEQFIKYYSIDFPEVKANYVRINAIPRPLFAKNNSKKQMATYLFVDEINVH